MLELKERERRFIWAFLLNAMTDGRENGAQAARDAGYSDVAEGAKVQAHHLLHRDDILKAMQEVAANELRGLAIPAVVALGRLVRDPTHKDHRKSLDMVLNRVGMQERTGVDVTVSGEVRHNHVDAAVEDLKRLKAIGVPRDELERVFGYSGLSRYERMLEASEKAKLIDGTTDG